MTVRNYFETVGIKTAYYIVNIYASREADEPIGVLYNAHGELIETMFGDNYMLNSCGNDICIIVPNVNWDIIMRYFETARVSIREPWR